MTHKPIPSGRIRAAGFAIAIGIIGALLATPVAADTAGAPLSSAAAAEVGAPAADVAPPFQRLDLHYFHPTIRCVSCLTLEALSAETVADSFAVELAAGRLSWQVHDFELPAGAALADSFAVESSTLIIAESLGGEAGRWESIDHIWYLLETPDSLGAYVASVIRAYLGNTP